MWVRPSTLYRAGLTDRSEECDIIIGEEYAWQLLLYDQPRRRWMVDIIPLKGWADRFLRDLRASRD